MIKKVFFSIILMFLTTSSLYITAIMQGEQIESVINSKEDKKYEQAAMNFDNKPVLTPNTSSTQNTTTPAQILLLDPSNFLDYAQLINQFIIGRNISGVMLVLKDREGNVYVDDPHIPTIITFAHECNLSIFGGIEILEDLAYTSTNKNSRQIPTTSDLTSNLVSFGDISYLKYVEDIITSTATMGFDGAVLLNLRYLSVSSYFDASLVQSIKNTLGIDLEQGGSSYPIYGRPLDPFSSGLTNLLSSLNLTTTTISDYLTNLASSISNNWTAILENTSSMPSPSLDPILQWKSMQVENFIATCRSAVGNSFQLVLGTYGNCLESLFYYGQNVTALKKDINWTIPAQDFENAVKDPSNGGQLVSFLPLEFIDPSQPRDGLLWFGYWIIRPLIFAIWSILIPATLAAISGWLLLIYGIINLVLYTIWGTTIPSWITNQFWVSFQADVYSKFGESDPPITATIAGIINSWQNHEISIYSARDQIAALSAQDTISTLQNNLYAQMQNSLNAYVPDWLRWAFVPFLSISYQIISQAVSNQYGGWSGLANNMASQIAPDIYADLLLPLATYSFQASVPTDAATAYIPPATIISYPLIISNTGTLDDIYDISSIYLPAGCSWQIASISGSGVQNLGNNRIQIAQGYGAQIEIQVNVPEYYPLDTQYQFLIMTTSESKGSIVENSVSFITRISCPFALLVWPNSFVITPGSSASLQVQITRIFGPSAGTVQLAGLPQGISLTPLWFNWNTWGGDVVENMQIFAQRNYLTWAGTYQGFIAAVGVSQDTGLTFTQTAPITVKVLPFYDTSITYSLPVNQFVPGQAVTTYLSLQNTGNTYNSFSISLEDLPRDYYSIEGLTEGISLAPGAVVVLPITIAPPRSFATPPATYQFEIQVLGTGVTKTVQESIEILPFWDFMTLPQGPVEVNISSSDLPMFNISIQNLGNVQDTYQIHFFDQQSNFSQLAVPLHIPDAWVSLPQPITLNPGGIAYRLVSINISSWIGFENTSYPFAIKTQSLTIPVIANTISYTMTITPNEHTRQLWIIHCLEDLNSTIFSLPNSNFRNPANNRKNALSNKFLNIIDIIQNKEYEEAYDEMLFDIKPKLTGLKIDEQGNHWGNGVFNEPWIIVSSMQNTLAQRCDAILLYLLILSRIPDRVGMEG